MRLRLTSVGCEVALEDIYYRVEIVADATP
jgi:hypothetical protein